MCIRDRPHVVFHSLRHSSITYKLKLNGGDMKSVQGDSGPVSYTHLDVYKRQLHKKLYSGTGDVAAYNGNVSSDESHGIIERQADTLASALLMPLPQIKKCFYRLRIGRTDEQLIAEIANIFEVSKQAMQIRLKSRNLI